MSKVDELLEVIKLTKKEKYELNIKKTIDNKECFIKINNYNPTIWLNNNNFILNFYIYYNDDLINFIKYDIRKDEEKEQLNFFLENIDNLIYSEYKRKFIFKNEENEFDIMRKKVNKIFNIL